MTVAGVIVGLGNPGSEYANTRHNCGFDVVSNLLAEAELDGTVRSVSGSKFCCELRQITTPRLKGSWLVAKPMTFMNASGHTVQPLLAWYKLAPTNLIVIHDELDIPVGELRFKFGGGNAGHNGLKSISQTLGSNDFYRLRVGIGRPTHKTEILQWVLGKPQEQDAAKLLKAQKIALDVLQVFSHKGLEDAVSLARSTKP